MDYLVTINADWGRNITTIISAENQTIANDIAERIKNQYGDPGIESIICSVEKI
jgi:hypothetical protein